MKFSKRFQSVRSDTVILLDYRIFLCPADANGVFSLDSDLLVKWDTPHVEKSDSGFLEYPCAQQIRLPWFYGWVFFLSPVS